MCGELRSDLPAKWSGIYLEGVQPELLQHLQTLLKISFNPPIIISVGQIMPTSIVVMRLSAPKSRVKPNRTIRIPMNLWHGHEHFPSVDIKLFPP